MDVFEPLINLLVLMSVLSIAAERLANAIKLRDPDLRHKKTGAREEKELPTLIKVHTTIGYGSPNKSNTHDVHGSPLGPDEVKITKENLGWPLEPDFHVPVDFGVLEFK